MEQGITGEWIAGLDKSPHRIELARTEQAGRIALRSTGNESLVLSTTPAQILLLTDGIREGSFDHVIKPQA